MFTPIFPQKTSIVWNWYVRPVHSSHKIVILSYTQQDIYRQAAMNMTYDNEADSVTTNANNRLHSSY